MSTKASLTLTDYSKEKSTVSFWVQDISAANFDSVATDISEVRNAIQALTLGTIAKDGFTKKYPQAGGIPTDPLARREKKILATVQDTTQFLDAGNTVANPRYLDIWTMEIVPCVDESLLTFVQNSDELILDDSAGSGLQKDLVDAIEANVRSPWNNGAFAPTVSVLGLEVVGRNL